MPKQAIAAVFHGRTMFRKELQDFDILGKP
jgi:hypothetical protein